jgi:filamentous hemagglutinin family protein
MAAALPRKPDRRELREGELAAMDLRGVFRRATRLGFVCILWPTATSLAQIATDGTVGPARNLDGPDYRIGDDLGTRVGDNLFHSFKEFNIRTLESATFTGPADIANVISRVTGGARSEIDGALKSEVGTAGFYFVNPAGATFGPNASIDVPGSFHVSTADELRFADGATFSAADPKTSTLTVAPPEAFGFLNGAANSIGIVRSSIRGAPGTALSFSAGAIDLIGGSDPVLMVEGGEIQIATIGRAGTVVPGAATAARGGEVTLRRGAIVDAGAGGSITLRTGVLSQQESVLQANSGDGVNVRPGRLIVEADEIDLGGRAKIESVTTGPANAGQIALSTGELRISDGSEIRTSTGGDGGAGQVVVDASGRITVEGVGRVTGDASLTGISSSAEDNADGDAGMVAVRAGTVELLNGGTIRAVTFGAGAAGSVDVHADRIRLVDGGQIGSGALPPSTGRGGEVQVVADSSIEILGELGELDPVEQTAPPSSIFASTEMRMGGDERKTAAGNVRVVAPRILLQDRGEIASETRNLGHGGLVTVEASGSVVVDNAEITTRTEDGGNAGLVKVSAPLLVIKRNGSISSASVGRANGNAGSVLVDARSGAVKILSGGSITSSAATRGSPGQVEVRAERLLISGGTQMAASTGIQSLTNAAPALESGRIIVRAGTILMEQGVQITSDTIGAGHGGRINISARGELTMRSGAEIKSSAFGSGDAGVVVVDADIITIEGVGSHEILTGISSSTERGNSGPAGSVHVTAGGLVVSNGGVIRSATIENARRDAGNVVVEAGRIQILSGGEVSSPTLGISQGAGGNVTVTAHERLEIRGHLDKRDAHRNEFPPSNITASTESEGSETKPGGSVTVTAPVIILAERGEIASETFNGAAGGDVTVLAKQLLIDDAEITATSTQDRDGGDAGNIDIDVRRPPGGAALLRLTGGGKISTSAASAAGGIIDIEIDGIADLQRGQITTEVARLVGDAGNVTIRPDILVADAGSVIDASTFGGGGGIVTIGGVRIEAPGAVVDVSSVTGTPGQVVREGPDADLSSDLAELPATFLVSERLFEQNCAARSGQPVSSLVGAGRGGLSPDPERPLMAPYLADRPFGATTDDNEKTAGGENAAWRRAVSIASPGSVSFDCSW